MAESGADLLARKEFTKALPLLKEDLDKYPSNPRIRLQYADALAGAGQFDEALAHFDIALKLRPDDSWAHGNRADALSRKGFTAAAIPLFGGDRRPEFRPA